MSSLIIYMSLHGCTEKAAKKLASISWKKVDLVNLKNNPFPSLEGYHTVIIGGSVHMGEIQGKIRKYLAENETELLTKRLGLYLCHMQQGEEAVRQFNKSYSKALRDHAVAKGLFGGEFNIDKMRAHEKMLVEKSAGIENNVSMIDMKAIEGFGRVIFHLDKT